MITSSSQNNGAERQLMSVLTMHTHFCSDEWISQLYPVVLSSLDIDFTKTAGKITSLLACAYCKYFLFERLLKLLHFVYLLEDSFLTNAFHTLPE